MLLPPCCLHRPEPKALFQENETVSFILKTLFFVVVKNLKPIKLRGEESFGMLLCASDKDDNNLELIQVNKLNPGDIVR